MFSKFSVTRAAAALAFTTALVATAAPAAAKDWRQAMERHYAAAEATKYQPESENPQWDFDLNTVVNDMAWRARTAAMLRNLPRPGARARSTSPDQVADRPEPPRLQFRF